MPRPAIVTGYIPIQGHPRPAKEYGELGAKIFGRQKTVIPYYESVESTWLHKLISARALPTSHSAGDNSAKNTLAYHCVQHQKFGWLVKALAQYREFDPFVWMDYGIGHVPGVTSTVVEEFMEEVGDVHADFAIPGCWPVEGLMVSDFYPCWRFCGGLMVVPRAAVYPLYKGIKAAVKSHLDATGNISWEVNTLARAEPSLPKIRWYLADHNQTMFTNYGVSLCQPASSQASAAQSAATSTRH